MKSTFYHSRRTANLLFHPIDPIFPSHHPGPLCAIFVIIVHPEMSDEYGIVVINQRGRYNYPEMYSHSILVHKYSYFYSTLIAVFSNSSIITTDWSSSSLHWFSHAIFVLFHLVENDTDVADIYLAEPNFSTYCRYVRLPEKIELHHVFLECMKLARPYFDVFHWVLIEWTRKLENFEVMDVVKQYALHDALNVAFGHMFFYPKVNESRSNMVEIRVILDSINPAMPNFHGSNLFMRTHILVEISAFSFVTCGSQRQAEFDYWGYLRPFSQYVWYALVVVCVLLTITLISQNYANLLALDRSGLTQLIGKAYLYMGLTLFEMSCSTLRVMFKSPASEKLIILWMLVSFVLVNIYKSIVTNDITAPLVSSPPRLFNELMDGRFRIYSSPIRGWSKFPVPQTMSNFRAGEGEWDAEILLRFIHWMQSLPEKVSIMVEAVLRYQTCFVATREVDIVNIRKSCVSMNWRPHPDSEVQELVEITLAESGFQKLAIARIARISHVLNNSQVSNVIGKCDKTVFAGPTVYMESKGYLLSILGGANSHINRKRYLKSMDTTFSSNIYIRLDKYGALSEVVKGRIVRLIETGFYQYWQSLIIHVHTIGGIGRKRTDEFSEQLLNSNILTSFVILAIATGLCVVIFLIEVWFWWRNYIFDVVCSRLRNYVIGFQIVMGKFKRRKSC